MQPFVTQLRVRHYEMNLLVTAEATANHFSNKE